MPEGRWNAEGKAYLRRTVGEGQVGAPVFSHLEGNFPLRLLSPSAACRNATNSAAAYAQVPKKGVGVLFVVNFGGGLVSGDHMHVDVDVGSYTRLLLVTQGTTKVFCERRNADPFAEVTLDSSEPAVSKQTFRYIVRPHATLVILPYAVTCFARSRYVQTQRIDLRSAETSSLLLLDWFTSGRLLTDGPKESTDLERIPEFWHFYLYHSRNEIRVEGRVIARDVQQLSQDLPDKLLRGQQTELGKRCAPYTCYATLVLYGVEVTALCEALETEFYAIQQQQPLLRSGGATGPSRIVPPPVLWSASSLGAAAPTPGGAPQTFSGTRAGLVVRLAGEDMECVREFLHTRLASVRHLIGDDMYRMALGS